MNFGGLRSIVLSRLRDSSLTSFVPAWFNEIQNELQRRTRWRHLQDRIIIPTTAPYSTGTITATLGSTTITGSGTAWTSAMIGQLLSISSTTASTSQYYVVSAVAGPTSLSIASAFIGASGAGQSYGIYFYQLTMSTTLSVPRILLASMQQSSTFHYPLRYIGEHELFNLVPNEIYASQRPWLYRIYGGSNLQLFPPPSDVSNVSIWYMRYPSQIPIDGTETGTETLDWPLELHYDLAKKVEAQGWRFLHDTEADTCDAQAERAFVAHVKENNKIPNTGMQLESWDNAAGSQVNPLQYPRTLG